MRKEADQLVGRDDLSESQEAKLDIILTFMEAYEEEHYAIDFARHGPMEILKCWMECSNMSASDLGRLLGNRSLGSAILRGKRQLSKTHIKKLDRHFALDPGVFL